MTLTRIGRVTRAPWLERSGDRAVRVISAVEPVDPGPVVAGCRTDHPDGTLPRRS
jgi:hypothetical protein